jgi:N-succinyldiaminopimelate aminotransferase
MTEAATTIFTTMTALAEATGSVNLGQGFPDRSGPSEVIEAAVRALRDGHNQYAPLPGVPALREAIADHQRRRYGIELDASREVQVTFGATEAIASALLAFVSAGDEVLMLDPSYDSYGAVVALAGGVARPLALAPPQWRVEASALERAITQRTRVLLLNSPHNPTGHVLGEEELDLIARACVEHDLLAITDEVYEHLVFSSQHVPLATREGMAARTITVSSLGKTFSVTGWKIGWATGPAELVGRVRGVKQFLTFAGGTPFQHAAAAALALPDEAVGGMVSELRGKRDRLAAGLTAAGLDVLPCEGTFFLNADAAALGEPDAVELCARLAHEARVVAIPTSAFSVDPEGPTRSLLRFAFPKRDELIDEAIERLLTWSAARR